MTDEKKLENQRRQKREWKRRHDQRKKDERFLKRFEGLISRPTFANWFAGLPVEKKGEIFEKMFGGALPEEVMAIMEKAKQKLNAAGELFKVGAEVSRVLEKKLKQLKLPTYTFGDSSQALDELGIHTAKDLEAIRPSKIKKAIITILNRKRKERTKLIRFCSFGQTRKVLLQLSGRYHYRTNINENFRERIITKLKKKEILDKDGNLTKLGIEIAEKVKAPRHQR